MENMLPISIPRFVASACLAASIALPIAVAADQPSYATSAPPAETVRGTIYAMTGRYTLTLEDERGFQDSITIHAGTVITPTGLALGPGQVATITGHADGKTFDADEVDVDPGTIETGQPLVPAGDYSSTVGFGSNFPAYAFGLYGNDGYANPYGLGGYYGGVYAPAYYYGYGAGYGGGQQPNRPQPVNPETGLPRFPVRVPVQNPPPGYRYPTGENRLPLPPSRVIAPQPYHAPVYRGAPVYRSAPVFRTAPAAPPATRSH